MSPGVGSGFLRPWWPFMQRLGRTPWVILGRFLADSWQILAALGIAGTATNDADPNGGRGVPRPRPSPQGWVEISRTVRLRTACRAYSRSDEFWKNNGPLLRWPSGCPARRAPTRRSVPAWQCDPSAVSRCHSVTPVHDASDGTSSSCDGSITPPTSSGSAGSSTCWTRRLDLLRTHCGRIPQKPF